MLYWLLLIADLLSKNMSLFDRRRGFKPQKTKEKKQASSDMQVPTHDQPYFITALSHDGRGITQHPNGKTVFVYQALPDETVQLRVFNQHTNYDEAVVTRIIQASPHRIQPPCPHIQECGGCPLQHLHYQQQVQHKETTLIEHIRHTAQLEDIQLEPSLSAISQSQLTYGYRRRARLSLSAPHAKRRPHLGFRAHSSQAIVSIHDCHVLHPALNALLPDLQAFVQTLPARHPIGHIELAISEPLHQPHKQEQQKVIPCVYITLVRPFTHQQQQALQALCKHHQAQLVIDHQGIKQDLSQEPQPWIAPIHGTELYFHAGEFIQINARINALMVQQAIDWLELTGNEHILELFAGYGNFSVPLSRQARHITAVELVAQQVQLGQDNAQRAQRDNITFLEADLTQPFTLPKEQTIDIVVLDPPRTGAKDVLEHIQALAPNKILYISCDPLTFARDARLLNQYGYQLIKLNLLDMFPHTAHAESMGLFYRSSAYKSLR